MREPIPYVVADFACHTGERPMWHAAERRLYWTDIPTGRLFTYDPATGASAQVYAGRPVGGFTIQADGSLLLFMDRGTVAVWRDGRIERVVIDEVPEELDSRFNDVIADPAGRVFCGTMSVKDDAGNIARFGRLYRLDTDGSLHKLVEGVGTSNGMGFTLDRRTFYHTDTRVRTIYKYDYDQKDGAIINRRPFIEVPASPTNARPDGLAVDAVGDLWSAQWDGGCVVHYGADGVERGRIALPTAKVSCPTFGGDDYSQLYITTAGGDQRTVEDSQAGALFRVDGVGPGAPDCLSRVGL